MMDYSIPNNPYSFIGNDYASGLDHIIGTVGPSTPSHQQLVDAIYSFIAEQYLDSPNHLEARETKIQIDASISGYINAGLNPTIYLPFNSAQMIYVEQLINGVLNLKNPEDIKQYITDVNDKITVSKLSPAEQMPLLYAAAVGYAAYIYWKENGFNTMSSWFPYVDSFTPAIIKFPVWISASIEGALIGLNIARIQTNSELISAVESFMESIKGTSVILALSGCLGVGAGKVIFKWQQKTDA